MLPTDTIAEITTNLAALQLEPSTVAQILAAVFAPLLRSAEANVPIGTKPARAPNRPGPKPRRAPRRKRKQSPRVAPAGEPTDAPRQRAARALAANPDASLTAVAKAAGVSRATVANARDDLARKPPANVSHGRQPAAKPIPERRQRAQQFLRDALAHGPKRATDVEEAAAKANVEANALAQACGDLGIIATRANTGGAHSVQLIRSNSRRGRAAAMPSPR